MAATEIPNVSAIANWFGSSRAVAARIGAEVGCPSLAVIPFAGGMSELPYINALKLLVNDRHLHVVNLAGVIANATLGPKLYRRLRRKPFHPRALEAAQSRCLEREQSAVTDLYSIGSTRKPDVAGADIEWAEDYAVCTWMGRGGSSGTRGEFGGALPIRYSPNGGGSAQRFHNWVASIPAWRRVLRLCEFSTDDAFDMLDKCHDSPRVAIYVDSPWPDAGDGYSHKFTVSDQRRLALKLATFKESRVVVRFADHPLIRSLYPESHWTWLTYPSRAQSGDDFNEVLLVNGPSIAVELVA